MTLNLKSVDSISSSSGKPVKRPINYFSRTSAQMAQLAISQFWGPKSDKPTYCNMQKQQYCCEKLSTHFLIIGPTKPKILFCYWKLKKKKNCHGQTSKFGKIVFWTSNVFLTPNLKSVNSISSSSGKPVKRPMNYFSRTSAQMAPLGISQFWGSQSKTSQDCEKLP